MTALHPFAPPLAAFEYCGVCHVEHSGDGPDAKALLSQSTHLQIKFFAKRFGINAQMFDGFGFQKWGKFTPRRHMSQLKEPALAGKLSCLSFAVIRPA